MLHKNVRQINYSKYLNVKRLILSSRPSLTNSLKSLKILQLIIVIVFIIHITIQTKHLTVILHELELLVSTGTAAGLSLLGNLPMQADHTREKVFVLEWAWRSDGGCGKEGMEA